jgi:predicted PurR-regulated permease PerM
MPLPNPSRHNGPATPSRPPVPADGLSVLAERTAVIVLVTVLILSVTYLLWSGMHVLLQAFAGVLFALFLSALSEWLSRRSGLGYGWSLAVVTAVFFVATGGVFWLLANRLALQVGEMSEQLPQAFARIRDYLAERTWGRLLLENVPQAAALSPPGDFARLTGLVSGVSEFLVTTVLVLFIGIFGAAEPGLYKAGLLHLVPAPHRPRASEAIDAVAYNLRAWLVGQVFLMIVMGVTTTVGLWLLGVPLALALGLIAGILELLPYLGPWLSAVPAALIALLISPWHLVMVLALYLALHILEGYVLLPLIQRRSVHLPPALTLVAQALLGYLLGLMGLFVAAPLTVAAVVSLKMLYVEDTLGDETVDVPGEPGNEEKPAVQEMAKS